MHMLVALMSGNAAFLTCSTVLLSFGQLDGGALIGAATTGMLVGLAAAVMLARERK